MMGNRDLISSYLAEAIIAVIEVHYSNRDHGITNLPEMTDSLKQEIRLHLSNQKLSLDGKVYQLGELKADPIQFVELETLKVPKTKKVKKVTYLSMVPVINPSYGFHRLRP